MISLSNNALAVLNKYYPAQSPNHSALELANKGKRSRASPGAVARKSAGQPVATKVPQKDDVTGNVEITDLSIDKSALKRYFNGHLLVDEQNIAIDFMLSGRNLKIGAFAGAGKTSTLCAGAELMPGRGLYLCFNKSISVEAERIFPRSVTCKTAHALAYREMPKSLTERSLPAFGRLSGGVVAAALKLVDGIITAAAMGNLILSVIRNFTQSSDSKITSKILPSSELAKIADKDERKIIAKMLADYAKLLWQKMIDDGSKLPITHDVYLKLWVMGSPVLSYDYILFDEAQDANPLMLQLVSDQKSQLIYVGDTWQQIYGWRGAVNAMSIIKTDNECMISQSFRFGQIIADAANSVLNNFAIANVNIKGFNKVKSRLSAVESPDAILCRTNAALISELLFLLDKGVKVAVVGGCAGLVSLLEGAKNLLAGKKAYCAELMLFNDWKEVVEYSGTENGGDLKVLVNLVNQYDIDMLIKALSRVNSNESKADVILSTVHKAKGREWGSVKLTNDFRYPGGKGFSEEEVNLLYVAMTRAKNVLDIENCDAAIRALHPERF